MVSGREVPAKRRKLYHTRRTWDSKIHPARLTPGGDFPIQNLAKFVRGNSHPDKERPKRGVHGTDFVEAHFVDKLFENQRILGEQVDAPLPIIEADRPGNDLLHLSGITPSDHAVLVHLSLTLLDGQRVPVLRLTSFAVHGIET